MASNQGQNELTSSVQICLSPSGTQFLAGLSSAAVRLWRGHPQDVLNNLPRHTKKEIKETVLGGQELTVHSWSPGCNWPPQCGLDKENQSLLTSVFQALASEVASGHSRCSSLSASEGWALGAPVLSGMKEGMNLGLRLYQLLTPGQGFPFTQPACHLGTLLRRLLGWQASCVLVFHFFVSQPHSRLLVSSHPSISMNPFPSPSPSTLAQPL